MGDGDGRNAPSCQAGHGRRLCGWGKGWRRVRTAGGCGNVENLSAPEVFRPGTGAIRQEVRITSRLSAPQSLDGWSKDCPGRNASGALRFSHISADARRPHAPPSFAPAAEPPPMLRLAGRRVSAWGWRAGGVLAYECDSDTAG